MNTSDLPHGAECLETQGCPWRTDGRPACCDEWHEAPCNKWTPPDEEESAMKKGMCGNCGWTGNMTPVGPWPCPGCEDGEAVEFPE